MYLLRQQVIAERKKRRIVFFTITLLSLIYLAITFTLSDTGIIRYFELRHKKVLLEQEVSDIETRNNKLRSQVKVLKDNPYYLEKYLREDFGMAKPDEYIFKYEQ
jgi:cell division protein FtsB